MQELCNKLGLWSMFMFMFMHIIKMQQRLKYSFKRYFLLNLEDLSWKRFSLLKSKPRKAKVMLNGRMVKREKY